MQVWTASPLELHWLWRREGREGKLRPQDEWTESGLFPVVVNLKQRSLRTFLGTKAQTRKPLRVKCLTVYSFLQSALTLQAAAQ